MSNRQVLRQFWLVLALLTLVCSGELAQAVQKHPPIKPSEKFLAAAAADETEDEVLDVTKRRKEGLDHIFQFDDKPLGTRYPVILLPGRAEEYQPNSWWKKFDKYTDKDKDFNKHFKLYVCVYDTSKNIDVSSKAFNEEFKKYFGNLPHHQKSVLVTYSLGGMVMRESMRDKEILDQVHTIYAVAVPFHGSPMFDPEWFSEYMRPPSRSPIRTFWDRFIYRAYLFNKNNLTTGLTWNNFDGSQPQFDAAKLNLKGDQLVHQVAQYEEGAWIPEMKKKLVVYGSYLENGYTQSNQPFNPLKLPKYVFEKSTDLPKQVVGTVLPLYGMSVHSVFTYMNYQLSNIPTFTPDNPEGKNTHLYRFNDGVIPLRSMLYLPGRPTPYYNDLVEYLEAKDIRDARVFVNLDHMHIGEYAVRKSRIRVPDLIHPQDGKYTPIEWLIHDIKSLQPSLAAQ